MSRPRTTSPADPAAIATEQIMARDPSARAIHAAAAAERARAKRATRDADRKAAQAEYEAAESGKRAARQATSDIGIARRLARLRVAQRAWHGAVPEDVRQALLESME